MPTKKDITVVFAESSIPVLEEKQLISKESYAAMGGGPSPLGAILDSLRDETKKKVVLDELKANGVAMELDQFIGYFDEFDIKSIALNIAATLPDNIFVVTAQATSGITIMVKPKKIALHEREIA